MTLQSARNLLTRRAAGFHVDVGSRPGTSSESLTSSALPSLDELGPGQLKQQTSASSLHLGKSHVQRAYPEAFTDEVSSADGCKGILSVWASKLHPFSKVYTREPSFHRSRQSQPSQRRRPLRQDGNPPVHLTMYPGSTLQRSYSYERGDDRIMTANVPQRQYSPPEPPWKETGLLLAQSRRPTEPLGNLIIKKSCELAGTTVATLPDSGRKEVEQPVQTEGGHYRAVSSHQPDDPAQLSLEENEVFLITTQRDDGWWYAKRLLSDEAGWVPSSLLNVRPITPDTPDQRDPPRRKPAIRQKNLAKRHAIYGGIELAHGDAMQFYSHVSQRLLTLRACVVCGDSKPPLEFPDQARLQCRHEWSTCLECVQSWIGAELESKGWDRIKCPEAECHAFLDHADISRLADSATFQRYATLATRAHLSAMPHFRWCLSPTCESGQIHDDAFGAIFTCVGCGERFCTQHEMPWHAGETCQQHDRRVSHEKQEREDRATRKVLEKMAKKCPGKNCGWMIEKNDGCDHMTCRQCRHQFCWICLAPYGPIRKYGNSRHKKTCRYHSDIMD